MEETVTLVGTHSYTIYDNNGFSIQTIKLVEEGGRITAKGYIFHKTNIPINIKEQSLRIKNTEDS